MRGGGAGWGWGVLHCPLPEVRVDLPPLLGTAVARSALPIPTSVYSVYICPNSGMAASAWDFNVRTDVDTCDFTRVRTP